MIFFENKEEKEYDNQKQDEENNKKMKMAIIQDNIKLSGRSYKTAYAILIIHDALSFLIEPDNIKSIQLIDKIIDETGNFDAFIFDFSISLMQTERLKWKLYHYICYKLCLENMINVTVTFPPNEFSFDKEIINDINYFVSDEANDHIIKILEKDLKVFSQLIKFLLSVNSFTIYYSLK